MIRSKRKSPHGYQKASSLYNVPKTTLVRRVKGINKLFKGASKIMGNKKSVLPQDLEEKLAEHILKMEDSLFGLTYLDVRRLGYELAEKMVLNTILTTIRKWQVTTGYMGYVSHSNPLFFLTFKA